MTIRMDIVDEAGKPRKLADLKKDFFSHFDDPEEIPAGVHLSFKGENTFNKALNLLIIQLAPYGVRPEIRTVLPRDDENLWLYINDFINTLNENYAGTKATLVLDFGSTSEKARKNIHGSVRSLGDTAKAFEHFPVLKNGGKIVLSFRTGYTVDADKLAKLFPPEQFAVEIINPELALDFEDFSGLERAGYSRYRSSIFDEDAVVETEGDTTYVEEA